MSGCWVSRNSSTRGSRTPSELTFHVTSFTAGRSPPPPARRALLGERAHALAHVLRPEARAAQLDELALDVGIEVRAPAKQLADDALVAADAERRVRGELLGPIERLLVEVARQDDRVDEAPRERRPRVDVAPEQEQLARSRRPDRLEEAPHAGVRVDEPELRRRHAEADPVRGDSQVAGERELEAAADRVAGQRGERRNRARVERVERFGERMGDESLGLLGEHLAREVAEVVAR